LRYNNWQHDPYSLNSPGNAISSRFDLERNVSRQSCAGGLDTKVVGDVLIKSMKFQAQSGPTWDQQPVFTWSLSPVCQKSPKNGIPNVFNFDWVSFFQPSKFNDINKFD